MDQATFVGLLEEFRQSCSSEQSLPDLTVSAGRADAPIVVLIHGIGGNAQYWTDPASLNPTSTWLFDIHARPPAGTTGLGSSPPFQPGSVTPWVQVLNQAGLSTVTWSQSRPIDLLQYAADKAVAVLRSLEARVFAPYAADVGASGGMVPPLVLLGHSRGGLVARAALKQLGGEAVPHLRKVITLCTPHHGSYLPRLADHYNRTLSTAMDFRQVAQAVPGPLGDVVERQLAPRVTELANGVRLALLHAFGTLAQGPGFDELDPQSATLQALADGEQPLPGVHYQSFGGANPVFIRFFLCWAGHAVPVLATASAVLVEQLARSPGVASTYGGLAELDTGDSAVGLASSQWPMAFGAPHQAVPVNHMQALIDPTLQQTVLQALQA